MYMCKREMIFSYLRYVIQFSSYSREKYMFFLYSLIKYYRKSGFVQRINFLYRPHNDSTDIQRGILRSYVGTLQ